MGRYIMCFFYITLNFLIYDLNFIFGFLTIFNIRDLILIRDKLLTNIFVNKIC